jgi:hypothetical protein
MIDDKGKRLSNVYRGQTCWGIPAGDKQRQKRMVKLHYLYSYDKKVKIIAELYLCESILSFLTGLLLYLTNNIKYKKGVT